MTQGAAGLDFLTLWGELAPGDLPGPVPEYRFHPTRRWRFDYAWPAAERGARGGRRPVDGRRRAAQLRPGSGEIEHGRGPGLACAALLAYGA